MIQKTTQMYIDAYNAEIIAKYDNIKLDDLQELSKDVFKRKLGKQAMAARKNRKGGSSAYILFCATRRNAIQKQNPTFTFGEVAKVLGKEWQDLSEEERTEFKKKAIASIPDDNITSTTTTTTVTTNSTIIPDTTNAITTTTIPTVNTINTGNNTLEIRKEQLANEMTELKLNELRAMCENYNLPTSNKRKDMINSIVAHRLAAVASS